MFNGLILELAHWGSPVIWFLMVWLSTVVHSWNLYYVVIGQVQTCNISASGWPFTILNQGADSCAALRPFLTATGPDSFVLGFERARRANLQMNKTDACDSPTQWLAEVRVRHDSTPSSPARTLSIGLVFNSVREGSLRVIWRIRFVLGNEEKKKRRNHSIS